MILILGTFFFFQKSRNLTSSPTTFGEPKIPIMTESSYVLNINTEEKDFDFPKNLPVLKIAPVPISVDEADSVAAHLGLTTAPLEFNGVFEGPLRIYQGDESSLTVSTVKGKFQFVNYVFPESVENKQLSDAQIIQTAQDFLLSRGFVSDSGLKASSVLYLEERSGEGSYEVAKENADLFQVNFSSSVSEAPILSLTPQSSPINVGVLPDGTVFKAYVEKLTGISQSSESYKIKSYEEFLANKNSAVLVTLDEGNINLPDIPKGNIKKIDVDEIELGYLYEFSGATILQPIFVLRGSATLTGYPNIEAILYLPAISRDYP